MDEQYLKPPYPTPPAKVLSGLREEIMKIESEQKLHEQSNKNWFEAHDREVKLRNELLVTKISKKLDDKFNELPCDAHIQRLNNIDKTLGWFWKVGIVLTAAIIAAIAKVVIGG